MTTPALLVAILTQGDVKKEIEPNDSAEQALEIREGQIWRGEKSNAVADEDWYFFKAAKAGPREIVLKRAAGFRAELKVSAAEPGKRNYLYHIGDAAEEFHFYPLLEEGTWHFELTIQDGPPLGSSYELSLKPFAGKVTAEEIKAAQSAIDRAVRYLVKVPEERPEDAPTAAAESLVLAALSEGRGARERRETLDRNLVAWLEKRFYKVEGGEVFFVEGNIYAHAMATMGLAEACANGSERGRDLALRAARFLIATQNTERKPKAWNGPVKRTERSFGGWRYGPDDPTADISVVSWCLIALVAVDAAGIKVEGLRDAIDAGLQYVRSLGGADGFGYDQSGSLSNIHNALGALVMLLYGEESGGLAFALSELDAHLWSATQVDWGEGYAFYYLYGAARAQFLRGGEAWEIWRAAALRQLLRRQKADGSWDPVELENQPGPRWTTAIGVMVLRLCLNEAPKYLRVEAKGF